MKRKIIIINGWTVKSWDIQSRSTYAEECIWNLFQYNIINVINYLSQLIHLKPRL